MEPYTLSALVTVFSSVFTMYLAYNVGMTRMKFKAQPFETTKSKEVMIANRVHMNCVEASVVFLPLLWMATVFGPSELVAGGVGAVWFVSRVWYAAGYLRDPNKRTLPFILGLLCIVVSALLALYGLIF